MFKYRESVDLKRVSRFTLTSMCHENVDMVKKMVTLFTLISSRILEETTLGDLFPYHVALY